jgi:hydrogenase nickel incorporation protein HypA/HybF
MLLEITGGLMHELYVTEQILDITIKHAARAQAGRVTDLYLVIGQLSSIVDDSLQFYWDIVSKDTLAEGAQLHFDRKPAEFQCRECHHRYTPDQNLACPLCKSLSVDVVSGEEFYLDAIDVEE